jgi:homoserine O-acetyltransferase
MNFAAPQWFWALLALPAVAGLFLWGRRRRRRLLESFAAPEVLPRLLPEPRPWAGLLREALRIADEAIVTFPNFAAYRIRLTLALRGRLPVSKTLPFEWYDTPNIHCITLKDFKSLCDAEGFEIREIKAESRHFFGKLLLALGFKNLGASRITARIAKKKER